MELVTVTRGGYLSFLLATTSSLSQKLLPAHSASWTKPSRHFVLVLPIFLLFIPLCCQATGNVDLMLFTPSPSPPQLLFLFTLFHIWIPRLFIFRHGRESKLRCSLSLNVSTGARRGNPSWWLEYTSSFLFHNFDLDVCLGSASGSCFPRKVSLQKRR